MYPSLNVALGLPTAAKRLGEHEQQPQIVAVVDDGGVEGSVFLLHFASMYLSGKFLN